MQKPLVGIAIPAIIVAGGVALYTANSGGPNPAAGPDSGARTATTCVALAVETQEIVIEKAGQTIRIPGAGDPSLCITYDAQVNSVPTVSLLHGCGDVCAAVNVSDLDLVADVGIEFRYTLDGEENVTTVHPSPVDVSQQGSDACFGISTSGKDPCEIQLSSPQSVSATASSSGQVDIAWQASKEVHGRPVDIVYHVYRSDTGEADTFVLVGTTEELTHVDVGLTPQRTYYYYILATADDAQSAGSEIVSVTAQ